MNTYYATFGNHLMDWHLVLIARDPDIARAYIKRRSGLAGCFCRIADEPPRGTRPLTEKPVELCYVSADHLK